MRKTKQIGYIMKHRGWWVLRYRERVGVGGQLKIVQRAKRLAPVDAQHKTKASVKELAKSSLELINKHTVSPLTVTTVGDFCERVYLPFVKQHKRPSTLRGYSQIWNNYLKPRCSAEWLREVKTCNIQNWLEEIAREVGLSRTTLKHVKNFLSGLFKYAAQQDYFDSSRENPVKYGTIPACAQPGTEGEAYSLEEIAGMLRVLPAPAGTIVATAAYTGVRKGELRGLQWDSYSLAPDPDTLGELHITRSVWRSSVGEPKTEKSKAPVPVIPQLATLLAAHRKACRNPFTGPIFANSHGRPLDLEWLYRTQIKDVLLKVGITWKGWHAFRRGLASNLNRLGVDDSIIQRILRHSTVATTQNHYIKTASRDSVEAMKRFAASLECSSCAPADEVAPRVLVQ